jgi:hypothetical protein
LLRRPPADHRQRASITLPVLDSSSSTPLLHSLAATKQWATGRADTEGCGCWCRRRRRVGGVDAVSSVDSSSGSTLSTNRPPPPPQPPHPLILLLYCRAGLAFRACVRADAFRRGGTRRVASLPSRGRRDGGERGDSFFRLRCGPYSLSVFVVVVPRLRRLARLGTDNFWERNCLTECQLWIFGVRSPTLCTKALTLDEMYRPF